jgi:hypothetical protein
MKEDNLIKREKIIGSKRTSNYISGFFLSLGGFGFFVSGLSSFLKIRLLPFLKTEELLFIPQGIIMTFYGTLAMVLSIYIFLTIFWDIGGGYNEFNKKENLIKIIRKSFPGKNEKILIVYPLSNIKSVKLVISEGFNGKRQIVLCTKDQKEIPISPIEEPLGLTELEEKACLLASFLEVKLEGL